MRLVPVLIAAACLALPASATKPTPETPPTAPEDLDLAGAPLVIQMQTYRFGALLRSEPGTSVEACAAACHQEASCLAWSLTPPAYAAPARCELKTNAGTASYRPGAVSGISETLRMQPEMRYRVQVPDGYQTAPEDELSGGPEIAAKTPQDLLGASETRIRAVMIQPAAGIAEAPAIPVAAPAQAVTETLTLKAAAAAPPQVKPVVTAPATPKAPIVLEPSRTALPPPAPSVKAEAQAEVEARSEAPAAAETEAGS